MNNFLGRLPDQVFKRYESDPMGMDSEVRKVLKIPEDKYYSVSTYPHDVAGNVWETNDRVVKAHKISKSDSAS